MDIYIELDEGVRYNRSTGIIRNIENKRIRDIELTAKEMELLNILLDGKWHKREEIEKKLEINERNATVTISRLRKKIKNYMKIDNKYRKGEYRCERIKRK